MLQMGQSSELYPPFLGASRLDWVHVYVHVIYCVLESMSNAMQQLIKATVDSPFRNHDQLLL